MWAVYSYYIYNGVYSVTEEEEKVICQAVLFSTDLEYNPLKPSIQSHFTYFSNMLIRGPESLSQTVQNWLEVCNIRKPFINANMKCLLVFLDCMEYLYSQKFV